MRQMVDDGWRSIWVLILVEEKSDLSYVIVGIGLKHKNEESKNDIVVLD